MQTRTQAPMFPAANCASPTETRSTHIADALKQAGLLAEYTFEYDLKEQYKRAQLLGHLVRGIVSLAKKNRDDATALGVWAKAYTLVFPTSNRSKYAFESIKTTLSEILTALTERMNWVSGSYRVKRKYQPSAKTESDWWRAQVRETYAEFKQAAFNDTEMLSLKAGRSGHVTLYFTDLARALFSDPTHTFSRQEWLARDREMFILCYFQARKFPVFNSTSIQSPYTLNKVRDRIRDWKAPTKLLEWSTASHPHNSFHPDARSNGENARVFGT
ncbi:hypothetical protein JCM11491_007030 [Sporobolomyces phaffii]